jgi:hypothetical protein
VKDKKYKYLEDILDEYINLHDELIEIPLLIEKSQKKFGQFLSADPDPVYKLDDAQELYKAHLSIRKHDDRKNEINEELAEVEGILKGFLSSLNNGRISYEKKDDNDKSKITFLFWLEDDKVKSNR